MKLADAQVLRDALDAAIKDANATGAAEINLGSQLDAMDDAARAELEAAIAKSRGG